MKVQYIWYQIYNQLFIIVKKKIYKVDCKLDV